jgi:putative transposase
MRKTYKYKLYSSKKNKVLAQQINIAAGIWNHSIALHRRYYSLFHKSLNKYHLQKHTAKLKKRDKYTHWNLVGSQCIQDISDRIDKSYKLFFRNLKAGVKTAPPKFCSYKKYKSVTFKQAGWKLLEGNKIRIGKKVYKYSKSREVEGCVKTVTVKRDSLGDFYLYFSCELADVSPNRVMTGKSAGADFGLKTFLTFNDGTEEKSPLFFNQNAKALAVASRKVSSKMRGSNNRAKAVKNLARVHHRTTNQRKDYHFKLAGRLAQNLDYLFLETLNMKSMQMLWGRKVSDLGFSEFVGVLHHQANKTGCTVQHIDKYFPSSKMCGVCGVVNKSLTLADRKWTCVCGTTHNRDELAANNIFREGASSLGIADIRALVPIRV